MKAGKRINLLFLMLVFLSCPQYSTSNKILLEKNGNVISVIYSDSRYGNVYPIIYCTVFEYDRKHIRDTNFFHYLDNYKPFLKIIYELDYTVEDADEVDEKLESLKHLALDLSEIKLSENRKYGIYVSSIRLSRICNPYAVFTITDGKLKIIR